MGTSACRAPAVHSPAGRISPEPYRKLPRGEPTAVRWHRCPSRCHAPVAWLPWDSMIVALNCPEGERDDHHVSQIFTLHEGERRAGVTSDGHSRRHAPGTSRQRGSRGTNVVEKQAKHAKLAARACRAGARNTRCTCAAPVGDCQRHFPGPSLPLATLLLSSGTCLEFFHQSRSHSPHRPHPTRSSAAHDLPRCHLPNPTRSDV